jgi:hypothetical protein
MCTLIAEKLKEKNIFSAPSCFMTPHTAEVCQVLEVEMLL